MTPMVPSIVFVLLLFVSLPSLGDGVLEAHCSWRALLDDMKGVTRSSHTFCLKLKNVMRHALSSLPHF
jgi:hypothetical protein